MANKLEGKSVAENIKQQVKDEVVKLAALGIVPKLAVLVSKDNAAGLSYANSKAKLATSLGVVVEIIVVENDCTQQTLNDQISDLNNNDSIHGILLELPFPSNIDADVALNIISPEKDVDGLSVLNIGKLTIGDEKNAVMPATPQACIELAELEADLSGKNVVVIGRGKTVGKPLINMLINRNATVTACHSRTTNIKEVLQNNEFVFVAIGKAHAFDKSYFNSSHIVIDAGINVEQGKIVGDVNPDSYDVVRAYSPVPGGVGVVTTAIIFRNLVRTIKNKNG